MTYRRGIAVRPSMVAGKRYPDVSRAYFEAVHAVLSHKRTGSQAAADLEQELAQILDRPAGSANARLDQESEPAQHQ